ncbi:MAG: hypothetical protein KTR30_28280 [Saprospiraceae bacterium]|nr:hypothetical protein [Saprospiraceae bacterium]
MKISIVPFCLIGLLFMGCTKGELANPSESTCFDDQGGDFRATAKLNGEAWLAEFAEYFFVEEDKIWVRLYKAIPGNKNSSLVFTITDLEVNRRDTIQLFAQSPSRAAMSEVIGCDAVAGNDTLFSPPSFENWVIIEDVTDSRLVAKFQIALKRDRSNSFERAEENYYTNGKMVARRREP